MNNRSLFKGKAIHLTAINPEKDAEFITKWTNSPEFVRRYFDGFFRPYTVYELKKLLKEKLKKADETKQEYFFGIHEVEGDRLVGLLHFGWIMSSHQASWFSIDLPETGTLEKFGEEVLQMTMRYAFMELSLHRIWTLIPSCNEAEIALVEKAGFLRETQRRQAVFQGGKYYDALGYGILRPEWKKAHLEKSL